MVITGEEYERTYLGLQFSLSFGFSKLYGGVMDIQKESDAYLATLVQQEAITQHEFKDITYKPEINAFHSNYLSSHFVDNINWGWNAWQAAKASVVPEGFVLVSHKDLLDLTVAINAVDLATNTDSKTNEVREIWQTIAIKLSSLGEAQEQK